VISNGLALCSAASCGLRQLIIGVSPDYEIRVRADVLEEEDGPVLQHCLQGLHRAS
jgi:putative restriction endonuclease